MSLCAKFETLVHKKENPNFSMDVALYNARVVHQSKWAPWDRVRSGIEERVKSRKRKSEMKFKKKNKRC